MYVIPVFNTNEDMTYFGVMTQRIYYRRFQHIKNAHAHKKKDFHESQHKEPGEDFSKKLTNIQNWEVAKYRFLEIVTITSTIITNWKRE